MASIHDIWRGDIIPLSGVDVAIGRNSLDFSSPVVPLLDVHMRQAVFHDAGTSGILAFNSDQNRLELNASESGARSVVPGVFLEVYDGTGGTTITTSSTSVIFDTVRFNSNPEIFVVDTVNGLIQVNMSGVYEFEYTVGLDATTNTRTSTFTFPRRSLNGGTGFNEIEGNRGFMYNKELANGEGSCHVKFLVVAEVGYIYGLRARVLNGANCVTRANASNFIIKKIE